MGLIPEQVQEKGVSEKSSIEGLSLHKPTDIFANRLQLLSYFLDKDYKRNFAVWENTSLNLVGYIESILKGKEIAVISNGLQSL